MDLNNSFMLKHATSLVMQVLKNALVFNRCHDQSALSNLYDVIRKHVELVNIEYDNESALSIVYTPAEV